MHQVKSYRRVTAALVGAAFALVVGNAHADVCGDGVLTPLEECEPPLTPSCSEACESIGTASCNACSTSSCGSQRIAACSPVGGAQGSELCFDVLQCVYESGCLDNATSILTRCYCGTLGPAACAAAPLPSSGEPGSANGPCALAIQRAFGWTTAMQPLSLTNPSQPGSYAVARLQCEKSSCGSSCFGAPAAPGPAPAPASPAWMLLPLAFGLFGAGIRRLSQRSRKKPF
jgi:hypothetical protein